MLESIITDHWYPQVSTFLLNIEMHCKARVGPEYDVQRALNDFDSDDQDS